MNGRGNTIWERALRGGADAWDLLNSGPILRDEFFGVTPPAGLQAVRFDNAADILVMPSAAVPSGSGAWTVSVWGRLAVDRNVPTMLWSFDALFSSAWHALETDSSGTSLRVYETGTTVTTIANLTVGQWYFVTVRKTAGGTIKTYIGDETFGALATTAGTVTNLTYAGDGYVGGSAYGTDELNGRLWGMRVWDAELSDAEVDAEFAAAVTAARTTNLRAQWLLDNATTPGTDSSGNGRNLTNLGGAGAWTLEAGPTFPASGPQSITAQGFLITMTEGLPVFTPGAVSVSPNGVPIAFTPGSAIFSALSSIGANGFPITFTPGLSDVSPGPVSVIPNGVPIAFTPGSAILTALNSIGATGFPITFTPGSAVLSALNSIGATGFPITFTPGSAILTPGPVSVSPNGFPITFTPGLLDIALAGGSLQMVNANGFPVTFTPGSAVLTALASIGATGFPITFTEGSPVITPGTAGVAATGLVIGFAPGSAQVLPGPVTVNVSGFPVTFTEGAPGVSSLWTVSPLGIPIGIVPGLAEFLTGAGADQLVSILDGKALFVMFGQPSIFVPGNGWTLAPIQTTFPMGRPGAFRWPFRSTPPKGRR